MAKQLDLVTLSEAGAMLGVSRQQVAKYIAQGRIAAVEIAGRPYVERRHVKKPPARKPGPKTER